jgi:hypothetical protein
MNHTATLMRDDKPMGKSFHLMACRGRESFGWFLSFFLSFFLSDLSLNN